MWILFALTSATILASRKIQEKKLVGDIGNALGWMMRAGSALSAIGIWLIFSHDFTGITHPSVLGVFVYCAFAYPIIMYLYYKAMHEIPLSVFGMMAPITPITALITSAIVLETTITYGGLLGIILVGAGVIGLFYKKKTHLDISVSSLFVAILAYALMGIGWTLDKVALAHTGVLTYTAMNQLIGAIATFLATYFIF